ncbi:MAG TPA: site-2 protease family protein [Phycisphaerae bacterium]|nr:site-2 protease family protein [Phycisphaerae bacterium]
MAARGLASGWPIARIFGIMISVHPTWIVVFALLTFSLAGEILPLSNLADGGSWWSGFRVSDEVEAYARANPGMTERVAASHFGIDLWPEWHYWVLGVIGALGLFVCVLAHELAHSVVALGVGIRVEGITLFIFGGVARIRDEVRTAGAEFRVAAAGPLMSVAIGASCGAIYALAGPSLPAQARALLFYFMFINLALVVFNMVPGFPLDGGRLLRATLWKITGDLGRATFVASWFGRGFAALLMGVAVLEFTWGGFSLGAVWWAVIGLFLWHAAKGGYQQVALREAFAGLTVRDAVRLDVVTVPADLTLERLVTDYFYRYRQAGFPVVDGEALGGMITLKDVQAVPRVGWPYQRVASVMRPLGNGEVAHLDDDLAAAFRLMMQQGREEMAVVENGRLAGILTRDDMLRLVQIRRDLGARAPAGGPGQAGRV